jgi:hypothetical protein
VLGTVLVFVGLAVVLLGMIVAVSNVLVYLVAK